MLPTLIVAAGLAILAGPVFAGDQGEPQQKCDGSTYEMVECLKAQTSAWDKRLNTAYAKALALAEGRQREQLRTVQRIWVQFRDANCQYFDLGQGTIARILAGNCMLRMTKQRACELESVDLAGAADPVCGD